jgi:hypothetical protein
MGEFTVIVFQPNTEFLSKVFKVPNIDDEIRKKRGIKIREAASLVLFKTDRISPSLLNI